MSTAQFTDQIEFQLGGLHMGKVEYLVKWKNYNEKFNSWEPEANFLDTCVLDAFHSGQFDDTASSASASQSAESPPPEEPIRKRTRRRISSSSPTSEVENPPKFVDENLNLDVSDKSASTSPQILEPCATSSPCTAADPAPPPPTISNSSSEPVDMPQSKKSDVKTDHEPPQLQVMVSETELWLINERNSKQKVDENSAAEEKETINNRLDVVITDVRAHDYSVIIKECYSPAGFFRSAR